MKIYINQIPMILDAFRDNEELRRKVCPLFTGKPGIGKSEIVNTWFKENNRRLVELVGSQINPTEVSGIAVPDYEKKAMVYLDSELLAGLKDGEGLLLEELWKSPIQVLNAMLTLVQGRQLMSGRKLPDIMLLGCTNKNTGPPIDKAIMERFMEFEIIDEPGINMTWLSNKHGDIAYAWLNAITGDKDNEPEMSPRTAEKQMIIYKCGLETLIPIHIKNELDRVEETAARLRQRATHDTIIANIKVIENILGDLNSEEATTIMTSIDDGEISVEMTEVDIKKLIDSKKPKPVAKKRSSTSKKKGETIE